jgi:rRNA maturation RNase YbeY
MVNIIDINVLLNIYPKLPFTNRALQVCIDNNFVFNKKDINIIFIENLNIKELNKEYRDKDEVTDVLSFNIDSKELLGEVYISPEYVINNFSGKKFVEEIIRLIVHGILHLQGEDHNEKFDEVDYKKEPMYIKQEEIVNKMLIELIRK